MIRWRLHHAAKSVFLYITLFIERGARVSTRGVLCSQGKEPQTRTVIDGNLQHFLPKLEQIIIIFYSLCPFLSSEVGAAWWGQRWGHLPLHQSERSNVRIKKWWSLKVTDPTTADELCFQPTWLLSAHCQGDWSTDMRYTNNNTCLETLWVLFVL